MQSKNFYVVCWQDENPNCQTFTTKRRAKNCADRTNGTLYYGNSETGFKQPS